MRKPRIGSVAVDMLINAAREDSTADRRLNNSGLSHLPAGHGAITLRRATSVATNFISLEEDVRARPNQSHINTAFYGASRIRKPETRFTINPLRSLELAFHRNALQSVP